ncbi:MAG: CPBP family intramembrane glutamic endopeptidase [Pirellulales bacterium]
MAVSVDYFVILAFVGLMVTSGTFWIGAARGLLPWMARRPEEPAPTVKPWSLVDLALLLVFLTGALAVAQAWALRGVELDANQPLQLAKLDPVVRVRMVWSSNVGVCTGMLLGLAWLRVRHRLRLRDILGDGRFWRLDLARGVTMFLLVAPPALALQMLLTRFFPSTHPLIEIVTKNPEPRFLWASGVSAVIIAPVVEELQFRALLQGWLQTAACKSIPAERWLFGSSPATSISESQTLAPPVPPAVWPVVFSALLFAAVHWNHGPDPIPLFVFALGLGWLYRRTGRAYAGMVVHFLLNLWTLLLLLLKIYGGDS